MTIHSKSGQTLGDCCRHIHDPSPHSGDAHGPCMPPNTPGRHAMQSRAPNRSRRRQLRMAREGDRNPCETLKRPISSRQKRDCRGTWQSRNLCSRWRVTWVSLQSCMGRVLKPLKSPAPSHQATPNRLYIHLHSQPLVPPGQTPRDQAFTSAVLAPP